jgi:hypothetical protein
MAGLIVALGAAACQAEMPDFSGNQPQAATLMQRARLLGGGQSWWSRYGEPVNAAALAQADTSPSDKGIGPGQMPVYGDGYIFGPGSCDCPPPCIGGLWAGYFQNPKICRLGHLCHRHCGCGNGGACGNGCGNGCGLFGRGCGNACGTSCTTAAPSCGCTTPVTCTTAAPSCGCKPVCGKCRSCHLGMWRGCAAHWSKSCNSCSAPLSCGCTTPAAIYPGSEKQAGDRVPVPLAEEPVLYSLPRLN